MRYRLLCLAFMFFSMSTCVRSETLRFGIDLNYPPFSSLGEDGLPHGFDVDMAYAVCAEMKVTCLVVYQDWPGLVKALYLGKFDAILSSMQVTAERKKILDFSDAYYTVPSRMISFRSINPEQFGHQHQRIGVLIGSTQESFAKDRWGAQGAMVRSYDKTAMALHDLKTHHLDAVLMDCIAGDLALNGVLKNSGFNYVGPRYQDAGYFGQGASIAVKKGDTTLQSRLNNALRRMQSTGVYQKIRDKYFSAKQCGE